MSQTDESAFETGSDRKDVNSKIPRVLSPPPFGSYRSSGFRTRQNQLLEVGAVLARDFVCLTAVREEPKWSDA